ncbi:aminotransferase class III-fold pyridoxal phosphate-dependent enzyme [Frigidibacter albus]|uniref:Aminotransferase class III-fold pyridoxal phosphate-dependent enzyme n=1 Tax=Frigidibacter albus TaxID=1465486 RepID=A0A6L8VIV8_9RHOB|nr:aspartate aminotransferase family protein [Frigidibacter albus]MZQ89482.1 aminotransferase class III-fold pyridoxal phosphate-dependent enzyme [Frigidibacter albus]NBE31388.1 aminotransferase class III-fold pyridoxal phosphate-dependent enzyme [Frigidibacter albus]GGH54384.1 adenosylmethionine-8-amino-7-oxononanoate aminotransferase [Frigidibacter albus]
MTQLSNSLAAADLATSLHPYTDARALEEKGPIIIARGEGIHVWDTAGNKYIEGLAGLWSVAVGFGEKRLADAAYKQMTLLPYYHIFAAKAHEPSIRLAEKLVEISPEPLTRVFYTNSGSEANDTVVKLVWYMNNALGRPAKKKFLARNKGYHGITIASGSLTGLPNNHRDFDLPAIPVVHLTCPHFYRFGLEGETEAEFTARLLAELEAVIELEGADTIAAFIGEPLMGAGGVMVPPTGYWPGVEAICRKHDILMVSDEVINGFGRTGGRFGCETYGFTPDIMTVSKQITSSYMPLAAVLFTEEIYDAIADNSHKIGTFGHGYTASGHPVATAVALENIAILEERDLMGAANRLGPRLQAGLRQYADHPLVGEVRGAGLIAGIELVADKATRAPFTPIGRVGAQAAIFGHAEGLIFRAVGDTLALCPPLIVTEADIDEIVEKMGRALDRTAEWLAAQG